MTMAARMYMPASMYPDHSLMYVAEGTATQGEERARYAELLSVRCINADRRSSYDSLQTKRSLLARHGVASQRGTQEIICTHTNKKASA